MVFVQKWPSFQLSFFRQYMPGKCGLRYFRTKKILSRLYNKLFKKSKIWHFSKGFNPWIWTKNGDFSNIFFFRQCRPGKVLLRYSGTNKRLSRLKNKKFKKPKNWHLLRNIGRENFFYDILERINAFLGYKKKEVKKVEKLRFFQTG